MRWPLIAACLLLPVATAQMMFPTGELGVDGVHAIPEIRPFETGRVDLDLVYDCAELDSGVDSLRIFTNATAHRRSDGVAVPMDALSTQVIDLDRCTSGGGQPVRFEVRATWTQDNFSSNDVLDIDVEVRGEIEGLQWRAIDPVSASQSVPMRLDPALATPEPMAEEVLPQDQLVPGPALPLLAAGLLALARRR